MAACKIPPYDPERRKKIWFEASPIDREAPLEPWKLWRTDTPPQAGEHFLARPVGYNHTVDAFWNGAEFQSGKSPIKIHQWLTYKEFTEIRSCPWTQKSE